jgi:LTXXQ motif family protein
MKTAVKVSIAVGLVLAVTAVAVIKPISAQRAKTAVLLPKDQSRLLAGRADSNPVDYAGNLLQLAQAVNPPARHSGPDNLTMADPDRPRGAGPYGFEPPGGAGPGYGLRRPPIGPMGLMPPDRRACAEAIDHGAGVAGYLKSKLHLVGAQKDAWQKIEEAAEPVVAKMREICVTLPDEPGATPNLPTRITTANREFAVRAEFVHAILSPAKALYDLLSPEQRAIVDQPPPPPAL